MKARFYYILFPVPAHSILPFATTKMKLEDLKLTEMNQTQKERKILHDLTYRGNGKKSNSQKQREKEVLVITRGGEVGKWEDVGQWVQSYSYVGRSSKMYLQRKVYLEHSSEV